MEKARVKSDWFGEKVSSGQNTSITVIYKNSGKKRPLLKKGWVVTVVRGTTSFHHGVERVKVITADGRMFSVDKNILEKLEG